MEHRVRKAIALAEESLHKGWSPAKLAAVVNLSPSRLHQLFKEETGVPPGALLCAVANLLDVGGPLADIVGLLNQILALL